MSDVLDQVVRILTDVVGEDFLLDTEITPDTTFSDDLGLESIEFVAMSEKLNEFYGGAVDFAELIGVMDINDIMSMTVGTLTGYIETRLAAG
jgi:acyl carrier protein